MHMNLIHIFEQMDLFARLVAISLVVMAVSALSVFVERSFAFFQARRATRRFTAQASTMLQAHQYHALQRFADEHSRSPLAWVLGEGLRCYADSLRRPGKLPAHELVRRELERKSETAFATVRRGMNVLASVGSVAPFVGLLGTVVGIIASFQGIAKEGSGGLGAVSSGISEALVVTALGLLVAIPAVLAFNYLSAKVDELMRGVDQARSELVDFLEAHGEQSSRTLDQPVRMETTRAA